MAVTAVADAVRHDSGSTVGSIRDVRPLGRRLRRLTALAVVHRADGIAPIECRVDEAAGLAGPGATDLSESTRGAVRQVRPVRGGD